MDSDGTWAQPSNMSQHYSYTFGPNRNDPGECSWLDHRGDLKHKKDLEEEYIAASIEDMGKDRKKNQIRPDYFWSSKVLPETGIPKGDKLTDGMRENEVHEYKVPLGVKFLAPAFKTGSNDVNPANLDISNFVSSHGSLRWIMEPQRQNIRGGNEVLPILVSKSDTKYNSTS